MSDSLIERLRKSSGPSRELDAEIAAAVGIKHRSRRTAAGKNKGREWMVDTEAGGVELWSHHPPAYTASLDAAMTLYKRKPDIIPSDPIKCCIEAMSQ